MRTVRPVCAAAKRVCHQHPKKPKPGCVKCEHIAGRMGPKGWSPKRKMK